MSGRTLALPSQPTLNADATGAAAARGAWTIANAPLLDALLAGGGGDKASDKAGAGVARIDAAGMTEFDTYGAVVLDALSRRLGGGTPLQIDGMADNFRVLFDHVRQAQEGAPASRPRGNWLLDRLAAVGQGTVRLTRDLGALAEMLGAVGVAMLRTLLRPSSFRMTSAIHHLDRVAWQAVPIILLITFLIGGIIAQQGIFHFRKFGADVYVVDMVGILVLREIGVLIVAIMVAGRSGSSYTAELGSMKMREEVDALQTMGLDPVDVLILPRVLALVIGLPILTFLGSMSALAGGELVCWLYGGMAPEIFLTRLKEAISVTHFKVGMIKAPFMALVIGVVACAQGLQVRGSSESLGLQTTASVVKSIFLVIVLDGFFAIFFAAIDM